MEGRILHFRQSRHTTYGNHLIIEVDSVDTREKAEKLVGKSVTWSSENTTINGEVASAHGNSGAIRVIFERGLPGQAITQTVQIA